MYKNLLVVAICFSVLLLVFFVPFFSEFFYDVFTLSLVHGSSYGKGIVMLSVLLSMSIILFIRCSIVEDEELSSQDLLRLKKKVITFMAIFFFLVILIASIGLFIELRINQSYLKGGSDASSYLLKEYVPSIRVYDPSTQILYGSTSTFHSHSLKSMFYMILPDGMKQDFGYDIGLTISDLFDNDLLIFPLIVFVCIVLISVIIALLIYKVFRSSLVTLSWTFISTSIVMVSLDGGILTSSLILVLSLFFVFVFLFFLLGTYLDPIYIPFILFFLPLLHFLRDFIVFLIIKLFQYSQISAVWVHKYELAAYYVFLCLMLLIFIYYFKQRFLSKKFHIVFKNKKTEKTLFIGMTFLRWLVFVLIFIILFNVLILISNRGVGINKAAILLPHEFNDTIDNVDVSLLYHDKNAHIYTLEAERNLKRLDIAKIKLDVDSSRTNEVIKTLEFCDNKVNRYYRSIYNPPELKINQTIGPIKIIGIEKLNQNITTFVYECECAVCYFVYNLALRKEIGDENLISFIHMKKRGLRNAGYYFWLFIPF